MSNILLLFYLWVSLDVHFGCVHRYTPFRIPYYNGVFLPYFIYLKMFCRSSISVSMIENKFHNDETSFFLSFFFVLSRENDTCTFACVIFSFC